MLPLDASAPYPIDLGRFLGCALATGSAYVFLDIAPGVSGLTGNSTTGVDLRGSGRDRNGATRTCVRPRVARNHLRGDRRRSSTAEATSRHE